MNSFRLHLFLVVFVTTFVSAKEIATTTLHLEIAGTRTKQVPLVVVGVGEQTDELLSVCVTVAKDLAFTEQFIVTTEYISDLKSKKQMHNWSEQKKPLAVCIQDNPDKNGFECRVYKTEKAQMVKGIRVPKVGAVARGWAHAIADTMLPVLTGNSGYFSGILSYINETKGAICVADYDGSHEQIVTHVTTSALAPRWNKDIDNPLLFYSEYTDKNIRLVACDMHGHKYRASSFDGLNMQPSFSSDGRELVLCLSYEGSSQLYHYGFSKKDKRPLYTRLTYNNGNNIAPTLLDNGDVIFCSDFENGRPAIYYLHKKKETVERLTDGFACSSPSYCPKNNHIAFIKMKDGVAQVMDFDLKTRQEKQVTFDKAHKQECSWSSCGNYIVFAVHEGSSKRIAMHNFLTGKLKYITPANVICSYPHWSFPYKEFPVVV